METVAVKYDLRDFSMGSVVFTKHSILVDRDWVNLEGEVYMKGEVTPDIVDIGHVTSFSRNNTGDVVLVVKWSTGETAPIHPSRVSLKLTDLTNCADY